MLFASVNQVKIFMSSRYWTKLMLRTDNSKRNQWGWIISYSFAFVYVQKNCHLAGKHFFASYCFLQEFSMEICINGLLFVNIKWQLFQQITYYYWCRQQTSTLVYPIEQNCNILKAIKLFERTYFMEKSRSTWNV